LDTTQVGGDYCAGRAERCLCSVLDLDTETWSQLPLREHPDDEGRGLETGLLRSSLAFQPVAAVAGRLVCLAKGQLIAWNPRDPRGWRRVAAGSIVDLVGDSAQGSCVWRDRLIVSRGRGRDLRGQGAAVCAFEFTNSAADSDWACGNWAHLGDASKTGRVGSAT